MYCSQCGQCLPGDARFCPRCGAASPVGAALRPAPPPAPSYPQSSGPVPACYSPNMMWPPAAAGRMLAQRLAFREELSCIFWICIIALQIFIGVTRFDLWVLMIAAWNSYATWKNYAHSRKVRVPYEDMVDEYDERWKGIVGTLIFNLFFGALLGIVPAVYDLFTRNFVLKNRDAFQAAAAENCAGKSSENNVPPQ